MATITKKELIDRIADSTGHRRVQVKRVVQQFLDEVIAELGKGNRLEFRDFGVFETKLRKARRAQNPKTLQPVDVPEKRTVKFKEDLRLTHQRRPIRPAQEALAKYAAGTGASELVSGYTEAHRSAEQAIARWKNVEAAVLLPSGYQAAHAMIQTLSLDGVRFLLDKLCHASLVDAVRGSGAEFRIFPHNNLEKLERLLVGARHAAPSHDVVISESIFSMDGDAADLEGISRLR